MIGYNPTMVTDGLVLCLDAANGRSYPGSGTAWNDLSGNGNHFTLTNGPTYSGDNLGGVVFDGVDDYALPASATPFQVNSLTIEMWFKLNQNLNSSSGFRGFFSTISGSLGYQLFWNPSQRYFYFYAGGTAINTSAFSDGTFSSGDIINLVCRFNTADYSINDIFVNNINSTGARASNPSVTHTTNPPYIGGRRADTANSYSLSQNIFIVKFYNKTLTDDEIKQNFNATRGRFGI